VRRILKLETPKQWEKATAVELVSALNYLRTMKWDEHDECVVERPYDPRIDPSDPLSDSELRRFDVFKAKMKQFVNYVDPPRYLPHRRSLVAASLSRPRVSDLADRAFCFSSIPPSTAPPSSASMRWSHSSTSRTTRSAT
jgi:hypothetical protein